MDVAGRRFLERPLYAQPPGREAAINVSPRLSPGPLLGANPPCQGRPIAVDQVQSRGDGDGLTTAAP